MSQLHGSEDPASEQRHRHASTLHALDHLERLVDMVVRLDDSIFCDDPEIAKLRQDLLSMLRRLLEWTTDPSKLAPLEAARVLSEGFARTRRSLRATVLDRTSRGAVTADQAGTLIEAARRLDEIAYYLWRITDHLQGERLQQLT
jgi:hypothetical protein